MKLTSLLPILLLVGACAETASFEPTENVSATGHQGQPAAGYDIGRSASGAPYVHVNVWSAGAEGSDGRTNFTFAFEIRDTGSQPVQIDQRALSLQVFDDNGAQLPNARLAQLEAPNSNLTIAPGTAATIHAVFVLPTRIAPENVASMRLRWGVVRQDGLRYTQFTEFRQIPAYANESIAYYSPVWGFYDPFFYDPFWGPPYAYHVPVQHVIVAQGFHGHHHHHH